MMDITKTAAQRAELADDMISIIDPIDRAHQTLMDVWEEHFSARVQADIPSYKAEDIGRALRDTTDAIFSALSEWYMFVGISDWRGLEYQTRRATRYLEIRKAEELASQAWDKVLKLPAGAAKDELEAERMRAYHLPDAEAIPIYEAILAK